jgi:hypothetical protein
MGGFFRFHRHLLSALLYHFDNSMCARVDQYGSVIDHRVAIIPGTIFLRHVIIRDPGLWQLGSHPYVAAVGIGRSVLIDDVGVKTRPLIDAQYT